MIPELGHFALILALLTAIAQSLFPVLGALKRAPALSSAAVPAARAQFAFCLLAFACLTAAFLMQDFSVRYVATNSNSALPVYYRFSAVWGAHEGSLLLWALILSGWTVAVTLFSRNLPDLFRVRVIAVMGAISVGFYLFMLLTSNPFERLLPPALEGNDLNPLLQDFGLIVHPPMLYMGYVGLAVPFSFAVAALMGGRLDPAWTRWTRPWTVIAWVFLTVGITLGSWWAYYELGWGGWWFWDPVENASFMPWLMATALIHSLAVSEQRGAFKAWTVLLAIFAFSLSLLGTFLVRSGVLVSVHAFATDPARGVFILAFLGIVVGSALVLFAVRGQAVSGGGRFEFFSRETLLLINNVLLVVASASVLLGTLYPLILDAMGLGKISVGPPYFNSVFVPLVLVLLAVLGVGPLTRWKHDHSRRLVTLLRWPLIVSILAGAAFALTSEGDGRAQIFAGLVFAAWVVATTALGIARRLKRRTAPMAGLFRLPRGFAGMTIAHLGAAVMVVGITLTTAMSTEKDLRLAPGDSYSIAGYDFRFVGVGEAMGPNYRAERGHIEVARNGKTFASMYPEKRHYINSSAPMTEAAIDAGFTRDLYAALGEELGDGAWAVRIYHKPFIRWIWLGGLLMALGGVLAVSDRRYRIAIRHERGRSGRDLEAGALAEG
ncbi:MAG: heme lyase CcmF/NrfE family subunit [Gammaproteobacteria bacterium]|nr:heme lyase CcmF/NrfE family subunit [Gammaproteobacteria bacterium]